MKIKVYAPSYCNLSAIDDDGYLSLKEGATLNSLYKALKIPLVFRPFISGSVNYKPAKLNRKLKEGDTVSLITFMSGG